MQFEESVSISASPERVFSILTNVANWSAWDPEVESASLHTNLGVGAVGTIKPKGAPASKITISELTTNKSMSVDCNLLLCKMRFVHLVEAKGEGSHVVNRIEFSGLLAPVFGRLIGRAIAKTLPHSLAGLKSYAQANN